MDDKELIQAEGMGLLMEKKESTEFEVINMGN